MNLAELKESIDWEIAHLERYQQLNEIQVLITLKDRSVGGRASSAIRRIDMGFDWESGQLRIEPEQRLIAEAKSRSIAMPTVKAESGGVTFTACQKCMMKVAKDDGYCRHCGQRLL